MLVIDDNKLKILRMKEKLLEVSTGNKDMILSEYKKMVLELDENMYNRLIDIIKNTIYHNLPLEEQLQGLTNLEGEYNSYNEFQCRYKENYEKYAHEKLELLPIDDIYIDKIKNKIDAISGYLINNQNLARYRSELERLNVELINAEKKKEAINSRLQLLEQELRNNVLNAEGRIDNNGSLEYASIRKEFEKYGFDLTNLLSNQELVNSEIVSASGMLSSLEEKMDAAKVCFNNMPNADTKKLYTISYHELLDAKYKINLLKFANLVLKNYSNYDDVKNKRHELIDLVKERSKLLIDLGVKFLVDPFDRIKLKDQLEIVELLHNNVQNVTNIKEKIKDNFDMVDRLKEKNNELYLIISQNEELFNRKKFVGGTIEIETVDEDTSGNSKVLSVKDISDKFNSKLVKEKTKGVIMRVYELFNTVEDKPQNRVVVPDLMIEKSDDSLVNRQDDVFEDVQQNQKIFETSVESANDKNDDLFTEVEPFQQAVLFTNKYDDVFTENKATQSEEMPELFFDFDSKLDNSQVIDNVNDEKELSFDEQIQELLDDDTSKVKKLVA